MDKHRLKPEAKKARDDYIKDLSLKGVSRRAICDRLGVGLTVVDKARQEIISSKQMAREK